MSEARALTPPEVLVAQVKALLALVKAGGDIRTANLDDRLFTDRLQDTIDAIEAMPPGDAQRRSFTDPQTGFQSPLVPPREFQARGYLQEVNRCFLHPLGLAMGVTLYDNPVLDIYSVLDARDDAEGFYFSGDADLEPLARAVDAEQQVKAASRILKLGYLIQPVRP